MCACVVQRISFIGKRKNETIYLVFFPISGAGSLSDSDRAWILKSAFGSSNQPVHQCRSILPCLSPQHLPLLARDDNPLLSQTEFSGNSTLVGDWSEHCLDDLGCSESELDDGSHFTSVFSLFISCLNVCRNHCDDMASEFWTLGSKSDDAETNSFQQREIESNVLHEEHHE